MNPKGLVNSRRNAKDGCAYFGTDTGQDQVPINDYIFSAEEQGFGKKHFMIEYDSDKNSYKLKGLEDGTGTFIKVVRRRVIHSNVVLFFNALHLAVVISNEQNKSVADSLVQPHPFRDLSIDPKTYSVSINAY
jgi:hypothetical protein